jgi:hypothetical protein
MWPLNMFIFLKKMCCNPHVHALYEKGARELRGQAERPPDNLLPVYRADSTDPRKPKCSWFARGL